MNYAVGHTGILAVLYIVRTLVRDLEQYKPCLQNRVHELNLLNRSFEYNPCGLKAGDLATAKQFE